MSCRCHLRRPLRGGQGGLHLRLRRVGEERVADPPAPQLLVRRAGDEVRLLLADAVERHDLVEALPVLFAHLFLDLGEGQLAVCKVRRSQDATQGVEFETPLVSDGSDGLCTRHRISPYALAAAGMPLAALPPGHYGLPGGGNRAKTPRFMQVDVGMGASRAA